MSNPFDLACQDCGAMFQASRITARYCGGTCRQRFNRRVSGMAEGPADKLNINIEISRVTAVVKSLREKFSLEDLIVSGLTEELQDALDELEAIVNPLCGSCEEKPADGWDEILMCRRCEIQQDDMYCWSCEVRRPSVKSEDALCKKCEKGDS